MASSSGQMWGCGAGRALRGCGLGSQGSLTVEGGPGGGTEALGDQQLVVLLARQGAVHDLVVLHLRFAVVPLEVEAGRRAGTDPQVLGGVNL